jgi:2-hydroxychromene-2-carboxylate isomerase
VLQQPVFYYDLGDPRCYLVGETIMSRLPVVPEWEPILASQMAASEPAEDPDRAELERLIGELGLQPMRWPTRWPPDSTRAMLAATYAKKVGRGVAFSLAAFRQEFAGGRDIGDEDTVLIAGAACEMHPVALTKGIELRSTAQALQTAGERAVNAGVRSLPAIQLGNNIHQGREALSQAASELSQAGSAITHEQQP